ncbi:MAG: cytochrome c-type biogenesis protein CcmH [Alphaproteobacteria bacterium]|nr:cytochrome c-type biogenesis protein CcmH [Alphaproteobacteria bacterium]
MKWRLALAFAVLASPAFAVLPNEQLTDPKLEARARAISTGLRCVVCQNQTIDDSDAELAHDLRVLLRQRLKAGDTDQQAIAFLVNRYGDYILLKPPFQTETLLLWLGPLLALLAGAVGVGSYLRRRRNDDPVSFTPEEQARLAGLLKDDTT